MMKLPGMCEQVPKIPTGSTSDLRAETPSGATIRQGAELLFRSSPTFATESRRVEPAGEVYSLWPGTAESALKLFV